MSYIYKITNDINGKIYIGQTSRTLEERFAEHCYEARVERFKDRPLYAAMIKYGIDHFHIEKIEETNTPYEREAFWIEYYGTFKNGYNATLGGDGKKYIDYDLVVETYRQTGSMKDTADIIGICTESVSDILNLKKEPYNSSQEVMVNKYGKMINMFDSKGTYLQTFASAHDAARYLISNNFTKCKLSTIRTHIMEVCKHTRKSAAGFKWSCVT
jgi:hypothetical protein